MKTEMASSFGQAYLRILLCLSASCLLSAFACCSSTAAQENSVVYCANLIYANDKTSVCFSAGFMDDVNQRTNIVASGKFSPVAMDSHELYNYPFAVMTGEGRFRLTNSERDNLRNYLLNGGFVVASAGCSSREWSRSFKEELDKVFPDVVLKKIEFSHPIFNTVYEIRRFEGKAFLEGLEIDGRIALVFSSNGLNDSKASDNEDCCCCGAEELRNARQINVNLMVYAVTH
ncbi:MAG TPA: DUF4159 domain-containing protein [Pirellulaceae bacterium]|mgnify:CR=1 FL=1|nr:DUF4159 domain-containing protein [Pirellulaceae bacterium]HMO93504.1 DUF4159 domain-containing protein [Pirellulaceae bacterium]HMP70409.1 DUF4159 domain-containing protein [Pirellulaceae bacterium]